MIKRLFKKEYLFPLIFVLVALHPLYEMDYLFAAFFKSFGGFRPSVLIDYVIFPLLVIWAFLAFEKRKKRVLIFVGVYGLLLLIYFIPHCFNVFCFASSLEDGVIKMPSGLHSIKL